ncbi:MlaD family protein [Polymorphobacter sp.]|uniref:MlaD family protein n=1 Tax=Polymorphobacter sp. TaxID=1909290 RepID=UPI003F71BC1F
METKSNYAIVGAVVLAILVALFATILWLSNYSGRDEKQFDILFDQAITGLSAGSPVAYNGVPVGSIQEIKLVPASPGLVRVRIAVDRSVPIRQGTAATIEGVGFTGVSQIQLTGGAPGAGEITRPGPYGAPLIPPRPGALGQLLASAPELLKNVSLVASRLAELLDTENRDSIGHILNNLDRLTDALADRGPEIAATLTEARATLAAATGAMKKVDSLAGSADTFLREDAKPMATNLAATLKSAERTMKRIDELTEKMTPAVDELSAETIPEASQLIRELRALTAELNVLATRLEEDPAGAISGGRQLPNYAPPGDGKK